MDEQRYWRNLIGREIKAEHDRVKKYYSQRGMNSGGISSEEQTRLNIFLLCQSIAEKYNEEIKPVSQVEEKPRKPREPRVKKEPTPLAETKIESVIENVVEQPQEDIEEDINDFVEEEIARVDNPGPKTQNEGNTLQNEFGELV